MLLLFVFELLNLGEEDGETFDENIILLIEFTEGLFLPEGDGFLEFVSDFVWELNEERNTNEANDGCVSKSLVSYIFLIEFLDIGILIFGDYPT